ncbi:MAG TPA: ABC transporter substrate-binding protein [Pseudonocardiaceae bacterium]|nr:ABC transporter substrate-binding protein [Pseudonocardiaceae bacterium]
MFSATITVQALALVLAGAACSRANTSSAPAANQGAASELRLGYFPNVTHAAALIGVQEGFFTKELGSTKLTTQQFNAGGTEANALLGGSLDAAFIGSGPAISAFSKSKGAVELVAGATSGGAQLVVAPGINSPADLKGKTLATPQLGNTQDVSLKTWLHNNNLTGQVTVTNLDNPVALTEFQKGDIQGAWLPEPWSSQLVLTAGAKVLVNETSLWPSGQFPTTVLVVRTQFLQQHPATVQALLRGEVDAVDFAQSNPAKAESDVNTQLKTLTGKALPQNVIDRAFSNITLTFDPLAGDFPALAKDQVIAGITKTAPSLTGFAKLTALNGVLRNAGKAAVSAAGLGSN